MTDIVGVWDEQAIRESYGLDTGSLLAILVSSLISLLILLRLNETSKGLAILAWSTMIISIAAHIGFAITLASWLCISVPLQVMVEGWPKLAFDIGLTWVGISALFAVFTCLNAITLKYDNRGLQGLVLFVRNGVILLAFDAFVFLGYVTVCLQGKS